MNNIRNYAIVDYNKKTLCICYKEEIFAFDLTKGDVGDFWYGFKTRDGAEFDINFIQETERQDPYINIWDTRYDINDDVFYTCDCIEDFAPSQLIGDVNNYFKIKQNT
jgi:hypothetical protein